MAGGRARGTSVRGHNQTTYRRRRIVAVVGITLLVCWITCVFVLRGVEIRELGVELGRIRTEQQVALAEQALLRETLASKDDPEVIEDHARDRLGLVMPGEEKVIFDREE